MKCFNKPSTYKLVDRFDNELRTLLLNDLNNVRGVKSQFFHSKTRARVQNHAGAACSVGLSCVKSIHSMRD